MRCVHEAFGCITLLREMFSEGVCQMRGEDEKTIQMLFLSKSRRVSTGQGRLSAGKLQNELAAPGWGHRRLAGGGRLRLGGLVRLGLIGAQLQ